MYRLIKTDGVELGIVETPSYIRIASNGCYVSTDKDNAVGVAYGGIPYNLLGSESIPDGDTVIVSEVDGGTYATKTQKTAANLDYVAMMAGVDIDETVEEPTDEEEGVTEDV